MKYEITIPATLGDAIPLYFVADAIAKAASTAYGTIPPHKPTYDCDLRLHIKHLLDQARSGKLVVCNRAGNTDTVENIIAVAKDTGNYCEKSRLVKEPDWAELRRLHPPVKEGVLDLSGVDLGPSKTDWDVTNIDCLYTKLHCLNEWGKTKGDEFSIVAESAPWVDERGYMKPKVAAVPAKTNAPIVAKNKLRRNNLDPAIDKAIEQAGNKELADVYLKLKELALAGEKPFTGEIDGDALRYTNDNNNPAKLTKEALGKRLKNRR